MEFANCQEWEWNIPEKLGYGILEFDFLKDIPI